MVTMTMMSHSSHGLRANLAKSRKRLNPELSNVTTQMKALDEYFLMVLLLNTVHVFANFMFNLNKETWQ